LNLNLLKYYDSRTGYYLGYRTSQENITYVELFLVQYNLFRTDLACFIVLYIKVYICRAEGTGM